MDTQTLTETLEITDIAQWRGWLLAHHASPDGIWVITYRKRAGGTHVSRGAVLDEALCFGWIDGPRRGMDDGRRTMQLLSPRRIEHWAQSYKDRISRLTREGRMHAAGLARVAAAKRDGSWSFMDDVEALMVPGDLVAALAQRPEATGRFGSFSPGSVRKVLRWIKLADTPEARAKRIAQTAELVAHTQGPPQM
ncbi:YdeI/OmpD-associated family protein [Sulfitobacter sabulilitoris]|uniref:Bacteriocin-protection protein n=1 Tax=Sulfitobacter sabulilitoris TaxID=2562655 RepID=A0A5S3PKB2_9RHOB|nr:YdeI/OmpD-associated family protein [Sulfitobacter sabulilitoris]TMM54868.1 hypothetical protein FDT80_04625 [Sulfitobacter sabulilitoris]